MNDLLGILGITAWKPILTALALPPVPLLVLGLIGARLMFWRRGVAWLIMLSACVLIWLSCCTGVADWLAMQGSAARWRQPLAAEQIGELRRAAPPSRKVAIVILGGGRESLAPEYGGSNLSPLSLARLHYGLVLARQINAPVMFSGGVAHGEPIGASEADTAARIADRDYGRPIKWAEGESRDTRENAARSVAMLQAAGINEAVIVTHGWHMARAMRAFEHEVQRAGMPLKLVAAPMGLARSGHGALAWLPTPQGFTQVRQLLREQLGMLAGA